MQSDEFNTIFEEQIQRSSDMLVKKAQEYASNEDRLRNFKISAVTRGCSPRNALGGMMVKHTTSVYDLIGQETLAPPEVWNEKITDHINYLILLQAIVAEEAKKG